MVRTIAMVHGKEIAARLSLFQKILLTTDGTVTALVSLYAGEPIRVRKIEQRIGSGDAPSLLGVDAETVLMRRSVLLVGAQKRYLFAESCFVFDRLPRTIQYKLLESDEPIGLMWQEAKLETYREIVSHTVAPCGRISEYFDLQPHAEIVSRTYVVLSGKKPLGVITESFPATWFRDPV